MVKELRKKNSLRKIAETKPLKGAELMISLGADHSSETVSKVESDSVDELKAFNLWCRLIKLDPLKPGQAKGNVVGMSDDL